MKLLLEFKTVLVSWWWKVFLTENMLYKGLVKSLTQHFCSTGFLATRGGCVTTPFGKILFKGDFEEMANRGTMVGSLKVITIMFNTSKIGNNFSLLEIQNIFIRIFNEQKLLSLAILPGHYVRCLSSPLKEETIFDYASGTQGNPMTLNIDIFKSVRVGLDIDGILADFENHFLNYLNIEDKSPIRNWNDVRVIDNFDRIKDDKNFWLSIPPLIDGGTLPFNPVIYVTARNIDTKITEQWLKNNNFPKAKVVNSVSKDLALKGKVDVFIEDSYSNYEHLNNRGINCFLFTKSHNKWFYVTKRIDSLQDFW